ncbi:eukaryotic translation initiation factor 2 subunit 1 [Aphelenchoides avenae]|nr:eukaryotic translation initiation factor 2 subunit 1 [Aphelenchus avenae]
MVRLNDYLVSQVYVGGLPEDADSEELKRGLEDAFRRYGRLRKVWVARRPPGFAFVEFEDAWDAEGAVRALHGSRICGVRAKVALSHGRRRNGGLGGGGRGGYGGGRGGGERRKSRSKRSKALRCRFYENEVPDVQDTVVAKVKKITELGAYVTLTEYNNKEGLLLLSELSRRRIRSAKGLVRVGKSECVVAIRVDKVKGYVDVSKRRVYLEDLMQCEERFTRAKAVNSILRHVAKQLGYETNEQLEELCDKTAWHFDRKAKKKTAAYDTFKEALTDPTVFDECDISDDAKTKLIEDIHKKLAPRALKIRADIEIQLFASPVFVVTAQAMDRIECMNDVGARRSQELDRPKAVTDIDEHEIKKRLELMDLENESDSEQEEEAGLRAPRELRQEADAQKAEKTQNGEAAAGEENDSD